MNNQDNDEPFLSRWSRMKRRADNSSSAPPSTRSQAAPLPGPPAAAGDAPPSRLQLPGEPALADDESRSASAPPGQAEQLDLEKLPKLDDITADTDIAAFLDRRVPAALRNAALGKMWTLDPTIRDFIEVAENQWNWNVPGGAPFYELIEPGSNAGTLFADATSAISRNLGETADPLLQSSTPADAAIGISDPRKIDPTHDPRQGAHDAAHKEPLTSDPGVDQVRTTISEPPQRLAIQSTSHDAAHQDDEQPRRRHGGALPA